MISTHASSKEYVYLTFQRKVKQSYSERDLLLVVAHRHRVLQEKMKLEREKRDETATACGRRREQMQMFIMEG
jgi:hypothetical protein